MCYFYSILCFDRFGHHVCVLRPWEEKCMECLATVPKVNSALTLLSGSEMNIIEVNKYAIQLIKTLL